MSEIITVLNHREANPVEGLLPRPAVWSSTGWDGIHLELYQQPKFATAEHQHTLHAIAIALPNPAANPTGYRWLDGQCHREERPQDGLAIIPAGVSHRCSWDSEAQFMVLALNRLCSSNQDLKLVELAAIAQISPAYFVRLFKQSEGVTPHQYILHRRIEQAQYLLRHSELNVAAIAVRVGFCDQSHLTRWFRRLIGVTPSQFRQS